MTQRIGVRLNFTVTDETRAEIERIAKRHNVKEAVIARHLLDIGLEAYQVYEKVGVPQLAEMVNKAKKAIWESPQMRLA